MMCIKLSYQRSVIKTMTKKILIPVLVSVIIFQAVKSFASFTIEDEKKLGKEFYEKIEESNALINDRKVNAYVSRVGNKVLASSNKAPFVFHFSVIKSSAINAFATPGGYVYVNRGLINLVENEAQLAGVLAHEIGHVNARHIADAIEKSKKINIATLAAILAGAFLGGGEAGSAAVTTFSMATAASLNLKYSREHEEEADRLGMSYLARAGYDTRGMVDFLRIMRRYEFYSNTVPSYFLTHPGTDERIRYLDGLLRTKYTKRGAETAIGGLKRIQTILMFGERNLDLTLKHFQNLLKESPNDVDALYGLAVTQARLGLADKSLKSFDKALKLSPSDQDILRDLGRSYFEAGKTYDAIPVLEKACSLDESDLNTIFYLARSYDATGNYRKAINLYRKLIGKYPNNIDAYYYLAMAYGRMDNRAESHYNFGIYFKKKGNIKSSLFHFREALKCYPENSEKGREIQREMDSIGD